jgi:hypothetical protein
MPSNDDFIQMLQKKLTETQKTAFGWVTADSLPISTTDGYLNVVMTNKTITAGDSTITEIPMGEQPAPIPNDSIPIVDLVMQDLQSRKALGIQRYGTPLQAGNGRDALQDAYEEALDLCQYLRQAIEERNANR